MRTRSSKPKKCGYSECGKPFVPQRPLQQCCSVECALKFNDEKEVKKRIKQMENNVTTLGMLEEAARVIFQKWVRLRDEKEPCISCGIAYATTWHGSHYFDAGVFSGIIFHPMNVNKSCDQCNGYKHGNKPGYRIGLVKKYGEEKVRELELLANEKRNYKYTKQELIDIATVYKQKIKNQDFT